MKYLNAKIFLGAVCALSLAVLAWMNPRTYAKPVVVLDDQQLMEWARDTYERQDWIYAAVHMNALVQRNPPLLRNNPSLAAQVNEGLKYSIERLQEYKTKADACAKSAQTSNPTGVASVHSGLTVPPPHIDFPH
jgi:hypothetical protein